ncbi:pseudouridine synthase [Lacicoccus alkaliphilus]|uniref:Pseudouridine synthase n=1 Tax=Lacicoccus alkaliphilus DSM 16010 TaxID=1123231 RepID=A0A1M7AG38_9BACL|nr:pseudouridine synthase [Salinicoccus alkaliphilus]SHL41708.1 16S rRNA pseudouridine516 synthase [Salinicoccus alkaliphilus DSM 16010]
MRLDKFLANANIGSRKEVSRMIRNKRVKVDGALIIKPNHQVSYATHVEVDGRRILLEEYIYLMLNKPEGVISSTEDGPTRTVMDLIDHPQVNEMFPVGRLDKDTTGLLLITNDGKFSHALLSPRQKVGKTYEVTLKDDVTDEDLAELETGIPLKDFTTSPAIARKLCDRKVALTIYEGKFHQVKRMFLHLGNEVTALKRIGFGGLELDEALAEGESRYLTDAEVKKLS